MAQSPVKSVVLKTAKPTAAQASLAARQSVSAVGAKYNAAVASGRIPGSPADTGGLLNREAVAGARSTIKTNDRGFVANPAGSSAFTRGLKPVATGDTGFTSTPQKTRPVKVTVHPDGKIEVHANHVTAPAAPKPPAAGPGPNAITHSIHKPDGTIIDQGVNPNYKPTVKPKVTARTPAAAASPALSDSALATNQVNAAFNPVEQNLRDFYTNQTKAEVGGIQQATSGLKDLYSQYAPAAQQSYATAENSQAAVGAALAQALAGSSTAAQAGLAAQLQKIGNAPSAQTFNNAAASQAQGDAGVQASGNSAALTQLIGKGAAAADYGAKLPGLAGLYGLNATQSASTRLGNEFSTAINSLEAQRPGATQTAISNIASNRFKQKQLDLEGKAFHLKVNADTRAQTALDNQTAATLSKLYGTDAQGNLTLDGRKTLALENKAKAYIQKQKANKNGLTPAQETQVAEKAGKDAEKFFYGVSPKLYQGQPVAGTGTPPVLYPQAIQRLMAKYPGLTIARATKILNSLYPAGEGGRPALSKKQQGINDSIVPVGGPFGGLGG